MKKDGVQRNTCATYEQVPELETVVWNDFLVLEMRLILKNFKSSLKGIWWSRSKQYAVLLLNDNEETIGDLDVGVWML